MELNLDEKVVVKNLCAWDLSFPRIDTSGDVYIVQKGSTRLTRAEIQAQIHANNRMLIGTDGVGSHARIYIDDKPSRVYFGFESEDKDDKQSILDIAAIKELIALTPQTKFEKAVKDKVVTQPEKLLLVEEGKKLGLNDFKKIQFIEKYTGYKFEQDQK